MSATHQLTPERIAHWQAAVIDGRRRVADIERRATYPENPDPDTVALAEHYRLRWHQARILKALSYFVSVTPEELCAASGLRRENLTIEVKNTAYRARVKVDTIWVRYGIVAAWRLAESADRDEIRAVIVGSWEFSECRNRGQR